MIICLRFFPPGYLPQQDIYISQAYTYRVFFGKFNKKFLFLCKVSDLVMANMNFWHIGITKGLSLMVFIFVWIILFLSVLASHMIGEKSIEKFSLPFFFLRLKRPQPGTSLPLIEGRGHNSTFFDPYRL